MAAHAAVEDLITDDWRIHGSVYTDPQLFALEQERIFRTSWVYVGHVSEVAAPGDYKATFVGSQPVVVARGVDDGEVRVLLNRCRHRGALVCHDEVGNAGYFRCPYHGWTYRNDGRLRGITYDEAYENLDRETLGLVQVPRTETYAGFIFTCFDTNAPSLIEHLGNARQYVDLVAEQDPEGIRLSAGGHRVAYDANWKLQIENTIDTYHFGFVHRSYLDVLADRIGAPPPIVQNIMNNPEWRTIDLGNGHAVHEFGDPRSGDNQSQIGDLPFNLTIFPNLCFVGAQVRQVLPKAVDHTEVRMYPIMHASKSDEQNAAILRTHEAFYGPAGMGTVDDIEIAFDRVADGMRATERDWLIMARGMHREQPGPNGTLIGHSSDELPQRAFYRAWKAHIEAAA